MRCNIKLAQWVIGAGRGALSLAHRRVADRSILSIHDSRENRLVDIDFIPPIVLCENKTKSANVTVCSVQKLLHRSLFYGILPCYICKLSSFQNDKKYSIQVVDFLLNKSICRKGIKGKRGVFK